MKFTSKHFLIMLFVCSSQTIICMENEYWRKLQEADTEYYKIHGTTHPKNLRNVCDAAHRDMNNEYCDLQLANANKVIAHIEKKLEQHQRKTNSIQKENNNTHEFHVIDFDHRYHVSGYCCIMLDKIVNQNNTHQEKISLVLKNTSNEYKSSTNDINLNSSPTFRIQINTHFLRSLSLEAQEAWCIYLVHVAKNRSANFTHDTILSDKENQQLFITLATKNDENSTLFNAFIAETVEYLPIDVYAEIKKIKNDYAKLDWFKKYAIAENQ